MSIEVSAEVWRHSKQRGSRLLLLVAIADYCNAEGWAWPSIKSLCQRTRMGERYVQKMLQEIKEDGELEIRARSNEKGQQSNFYRVRITPVNNGTPPVHDAPPDEPEYTPPVNRSTPNPSIQPSRNHQEGDSPLTPDGGGESSIKSKMTGFDDFWSAYPVKKKKETAQRAWKRHGCSAKLEEILLAITIQKTWPGWLKSGGRFIPHPSTWLNSHAWDDEESSTETKQQPKKGF